MASVNHPFFGIVNGYITKNFGNTGGNKCFGVIPGFLGGFIFWDTADHQSLSQLTIGATLNSFNISRLPFFQDQDQRAQVGGQASLVALKWSFSVLQRRCSVPEQSS